MSSLSSSLTQQQVENFIFELWYKYMKNILDEICQIYEIDDECKELLYRLHLRPNDFILAIIPE